ncbi:hypothetical protein CDL15_Pgr020915 [Punica granatum]|uniref:Uncharacterized protein n=1 Tax=Punica granatum TaxID=22663 RepID=A0A218XWS0_PUNGR|nr:hypothetical protein CDL15_Pgr020915 [Punica granatum]
MTLTLSDDMAELIEDSEQILSKSRQGKNAMQHQQQEINKSSALLDITNNSPIVGLAMGSLQTPSSSVAKKRSNFRKVMTPGSGEALLRGQVKTLLQKVEEKVELSKIPLETRPIFPYLQGFVDSPMGLLLAPTPANTPQVLNLSEDESAKNGLDLVTSSLNPNQELISQVVNETFDGKEHGEESLESQKSLITRSLLLDFSDKSEISDASECSSVLTQADGDTQEHNKDKSLTDEDNSSVWSIQANASTEKEDFDEEAEEEEEEIEEDDNEDYYDDNDLEEENGGSVEELCSGIEKISIMAVKFEGKHKRFVYNNDDEIVGEEEEEEEEKEVSGTGEGVSSPSIVKLNGLPTPKGKHMRFPLMEEDKEEEADSY